MAFCQKVANRGLNVYLTAPLEDQDAKNKEKHDNNTGPLKGDSVS